METAQAHGARCSSPLARLLGPEVQTVDPLTCPSTAWASERSPGFDRLASEMGINPRTGARRGHRPHGLNGKAAVAYLEDSR